MDVVLLSRLQFALTIMFHYLFPPLTIGMSVVLVWLEGRWLATGDSLFHSAARFWTRIFALNFAVGVATGIVMEFEFGTNWAAYSRFVGDVFGSALAAEGIFAFFLESGFLAVLVFGWDRVGRKMHFFATCMVCLGSIFSSIWIVVANSWQQTPAGHHIVQMTRDGKPWFIDGEPVLRAEITDFWGLVFNPSTVHRLVHVWLGAFLLGAFFVMSISAWYLLQRRHGDFARRSFRGALLLALASALAIVVSGDLQSKNVAKEQPAKLAALEAHYHTGPGDLAIFGIPDDHEGRLRAKVAVPGLLSWLLYEDVAAPVLGLDAFRAEHRPPVAMSFFTYRMMVGSGFALAGLSLLAALLLWRGKLFETRWLLWIFVLAVVPAMLANEAGWVAAEVGRQPWIVVPPVARDASGAPLRDAEGFVRYETVTVPRADGTPRETYAGLLTTKGISEAVHAEQVLGSILLFGAIYLLLGALWIFVLDRKIREGPEPAGASPGHGHLADVAISLTGHTESLTGPRKGAGA
ncbi:MAG: cytochrome ubiquinol oxidase subunit I [bacterium]